jgi:putative ubiquitin-RnfH superfamily antitoxin RatB of RatAB toxin-antitoxin module
VGAGRQISLHEYKFAIYSKISVYTEKRFPLPRKNRIVKHKPFLTDNFDCNKKRYQNKIEAQKAAEFQMLENMTISLSIYKCDLCSHWHLTRSIKN